MFKLLTRSTDLQKCKDNVQTRITPSTGPTNVSQMSTESPGQSLPNVFTARGIKRKRENANFEEHSRNPHRLDRSSRENSASRNPGDSASKIVDGMLGVDECRRILKSLKLKITLMAGVAIEDDKPVTSKSRFKAKRKEPEKASMKSTARQLTSQPLVNFSLLRTKYNISRRLFRNLKAQGYLEPTEVQVGCLPLLLGSDIDRGLPQAPSNGDAQVCPSDMDLLVVAPTGSGKTLAYLVPLINDLVLKHHKRRLLPNSETSEDNIQVVILAPTHELTDQIVNEGKRLSLGTGVKIVGLRKGMKLHPPKFSEETARTVPSMESIHDTKESTNLQSTSAEIVVSTPLNLLHAIEAAEADNATDKESPLSFVQHLILDEADILLDPLFRSQTLSIWEACNHQALRVSIWSATIGSSIETLAQSAILSRRRRLSLSLFHHTIIRLVVGLKDSSLPSISHRLVYAATEQGKLLALRQLLRPSANTPLVSGSATSQSLRPPFLVFTQTISRAIALHSELKYDIPSEAGGSSRMAVLHSDLTDHARSEIMTKFRRGEIWILITTDLLSRGVDFKGLNGVVSYDIPNTGAGYVHRAGRTGRAGREGGVAITFYTKEDIPYVKNIANVIAASEKGMRSLSLKANDSSQSGASPSSGIKSWLLDALPSVSKKTRRELKTRGVEARRNLNRVAGKEGGTMRISTKSGFERRRENNRRGAVQGTRRRAAEAERETADGIPDDDDDDNDEWAGLGE
ncbi:RNA-dependent ATPase rok1 [Bachmanniomyces sp. S44760]|nr:RNA-dependent ATPase rok1 [Bachmanniomyces sp. S44760]